MPLRTFILALVLLCLATHSMAATAPPLAPEPSVSARVGTLSNARVQIGHAILVLELGQASPLVAGGRTVGFFFKGTGSFDYTSDLVLERAVMNHNLAKNSHMHPEETPAGLRIHDRIKEVSVFLAGQPGPEFKTVPTGVENPMASPFQELWKRFFNQGPAVPAQHLAHQALEGENKPFVEMIVHGERDDWYYHFDGVQTLVERLFIHGSNGTALISRLPIGWDLKDPVGSAFTLTHVDLALSLDPSLHGELVAKETLMPAQPGLKAIRLQLISVDQYLNENPWVWKVNSVQDGQGRQLPFDHRDGQLLVSLEEPTQVGVPLSLTFRISNPVLNRFTLSDYWELGVMPWFPMPELAGQYYTVKAFMRVPAPYLPFMGGTTIRRNQAGEFNELEVVINRPVQFFTMHAGNYRVTELKEGDLLIRVCSSKVLGGQEERLAKITQQMIRGYETFLGPFPFREFNIIQRPVWGHGQAPPGLMMITTEAFNSLGSSINQRFSKGINQRVAHEIAHQYWGHAVKMPTYDEQWITESFAEYSSALMMLKTKDQGQSAYDTLTERWEQNAKIAAPVSSIFTANNIAELSMPSNGVRDRNHLIYDKGALVLYRLHKDIGDTAFFHFLRTVQSGLNFKFATTLDLIEALKVVTKKDMTSFFDTYFWGTAMPPR